MVYCVKQIFLVAIFFGRIYIGEKGKVYLLELNVIYIHIKNNNNMNIYIYIYIYYMNIKFIFYLFPSILKLLVL